MKEQIDSAICHLESAHARLLEEFQAVKMKLEILTHLSDGLIFITTAGRITLFNPAAAAITGYAQNEILESLYWDHFSDTLFGFSMRSALKNQTVCHRAYLTLGTSKEVEISTSNVPKKGLLLLMHDRTEQQQLEKSLHQSERLKELGEMAATLAHEIRNPLGGIEGFAQLLKRDLQRTDHQKMIQAILEGTRTLNHLVTNVLDYARPLQLHFTPTDLVTLVKETIAFASFEQPIQFHASVKNQMLSLDKDRIKLVLLNLFRNAFESGAKCVEVELTQEYLSITDNGEGIEKEHLEKIFTPFFTTKPTGTGIGLAEAAAVIQAHNGAIEVNSKKGEGTTFKIKLPRIA